jgi:hypothetical protein
MPSTEIISAILDKYRRSEDLDQQETTLLHEWLHQSTENRLQFDAIAIAAPMSTDSATKNNNNGSANAFDATENPSQLEKDISDDDIDRFAIEGE